MTYYQTNTDNDVLICDDCGETKWKIDHKYGTNVDSRLQESKETGIRWSWVPRYGSGDWHGTCIICNGIAK